MHRPIAFMLLAAITSPLLAQAQPAPTAAPAPAPRLNLDTPIETIAADPAGKVVLNTVIPELLGHESYFEFKHLSLNAVQPMSQGQLTDAMMARVKTELAAIR